MKNGKEEQQVVNGIGLAMRVGMAAFIPAFMAALAKEGLEIRVKSQVEGVQLPLLDADGNPV
jgi:hypothetical protein